MPGIRKALLPLALCAAALAAEKLPKPDHIAMPPTPEQSALVKEGIKLHDAGDYEGAIAKYKQALAENPWEVGALYELAFSSYRAKKYDDALAAARQGARCKSRLLPQFWMIIANVLDDQGKSKEAIDIYRSAIKQSPDEGILHYNLAITLHRAGKPQEAKDAVEKALAYGPAHPSGNLTLAALYRELGYRMPAVMAYSVFLTLEPESPRAKEAIPILMNLLTSGVSQGDKPGHINITLSAPSKERLDEGDFTGAEMMMSLMAAADLIVDDTVKEKPKPATPFARMASLYGSLGEAVGNVGSKKGFAAVHYAPYFAALAKEGYTEAFVAHAWKSQSIEGAEEWAKANPEKIEAFLRWSKMFPWRAK